MYVKKIMKTKALISILIIHIKISGLLESNQLPFDNQGVKPLQSNALPNELSPDFAVRCLKLAKNMLLPNLQIYIM